MLIILLYENNVIKFCYTVHKGTEALKAPVLGKFYFILEQ